jgi:predicted O-linked N-acetylglucosamine transferase (SPINDLY family)
MKPVAGSYQLSSSQEKSVVEVCQPVLAEAVNEAERLMAAMQQDLAILDMAVALAPYVVADADFQHKRFRIVGQLIQQGRALAQFQVREIIQSIQLWAASNLLDRGLSLSLPYFDDHALEMRCWQFQVIPAGRTLFSPAFMVRAVWLEQEKLSRYPCLSPSTRKHLLEEFNSLERAFDGAAGY